MVFLHAVLLFNFSILVYVLNEFNEMTAILRMLARLYHSQALFQLFLQGLMNVVTALAILDKRQLYEPNFILVQLQYCLFIEICWHFEIFQYYLGDIIGIVCHCLMWLPFEAPPQARKQKIPRKRIHVFSHFDWEVCLGQDYYLHLWMLCW